MTTYHDEYERALAYANVPATGDREGDTRPRAWHLTSEQTRSLLDSAVTKEQLRHVEHLLRGVWPDYTETPSPDTANDYAYAAWRAANRGDEIPRFDFTDFNTRHRLAVKRALVSGLPVPDRVVRSHGLDGPPRPDHLRLEATLPDTVTGIQHPHKYT